MKKSLLFSLYAMLALSVACTDTKKEASLKPETSATAQKIPENVKELLIIKSKIGTGAVAVKGKPISVHYTGWLLDPKAKDKKGKEFDSSRKRDEPIRFTHGTGMVIKGWDQGIEGMKVGGMRTLVIPPKLGYGNRDMGPIPSGSTLIFDVELVEVH